MSQERTWKTDLTAQVIRAKDPFETPALFVVVDPIVNDPYRRKKPASNSELVPTVTPFTVAVNVAKRITSATKANVPVLEYPICVLRY